MSTTDSSPADEEKGLPHHQAQDARERQQHNPVGPAPPEDGGMMAWLQVVCSFMLTFNTFGLINTFGVYQTYYESNPFWSASSSDIAWIGSFQALVSLLTGLVAGPIYDHGHLRILLVVGSFLIVFGHMMLSLQTAFYQVLLAQGLCVGLGAGCLFIPSIAILPGYFNKRLGLAIGLAASGSSTGGIIYPIMFYKLVSEVGFRWGVRILGFTVLGTLLIPIFVMRMRAKPPRARSVVDWTAFTEWPFMLFVVGGIIGFAGLYDAVFYTSYYSEATGYTSDSLAFYLVPILNAGSILGRTLPNWLSDKVGPFNVITPGAILAGINLFCYLAVYNAAGMIVSAFFFGFFSGIFLAMPPVVFVALTKDKSKIGTRVGMGFAMFSIGVLAGGPGGGAILGTGSYNLHWTPTWIYGGTTLVGAGVVFLVLRVWRGGLKLMVKV